MGDIFAKPLLRANKIYIRFTMQSQVRTGFWPEVILEGFICVHFEKVIHRPNLKWIGQRVLELSHGNEWPHRWITPENVVKTSQNILKLLCGHHFSKWLSGGHTGFPIRLKCNPNLPWIEMNHPWKFGKDISKHSSFLADVVFQNGGLVAILDFQSS